jgi:hypothetical protein
MERLCPVRCHATKPSPTQARRPMSYHPVSPKASKPGLGSGSALGRYGQITIAHLRSSSYVSAMTTSVAIYTRLSSDTPGREQTATKRQERDCRVFAQLREWEVSDLYEDVDLSAYKKGVKRPAYESLLKAIETRRVSGMVAAHRPLKTRAMRAKEPSTRSVVMRAPARSAQSQVGPALRSCIPEPMATRSAACSKRWPR